MTSSAVIATQLTSTTAYPYALYLGSLNVIAGTGGNAPSVPFDTIDLTEIGPGGASALSFTIQDPQGQVPIPPAAMNVQLWDLTNNLPMFNGFVQDKNLRPFPPLGRYIDVTAIGIEALLDWMIVPSLTIVSGTATNTAIQSCYANATGVGFPLRVTSSVSDNGTQANPIGDLGGGAGPGTATQLDVVLAGETLREAIRKVIDVSTIAGVGFGFKTASTGVATVDFWGGLRVFDPTAGPSDYAALAFDDSAVGLIHTGPLNHEIDDTGVIRQVYVKGGNAAGTGLLSDGSGIPGPVNLLDDSTILTSTARDAAGYAYLADKHGAERGEAGMDTVRPTTNIRAGSLVTIGDTLIGQPGNAYPIASIHKTFTDTLQNWEVAYGGLRPSAMRHLRRLTRYVRS
jgi:hypothetical protein